MHVDDCVCVFCVSVSVCVRANTNTSGEEKEWRLHGNKISAKTLLKPCRL